LGGEFVYGANALKKILCLVFLLMFGFVLLGHAQQFDVAFGVGTTQSTSGSEVSASDIASGNHTPVNVGGGAYPAFSVDYLFHKHFGIGGEVAWRASQNTYPNGFAQPFRPIFWDFNGVYAPSLGLSRRVAPEFSGGIGAETTRYYQGFLTCTGNAFFGTCTNYQSVNHFMGHVGVGLKLYAAGNFFIRPEAHFYFVHNNQEFSSGNVRRYGASIGYTFGER
jgi:hypothetical protein